MAKLEATLHERASQFGNEITLQDWNEGLQHVSQKITNLEQWAKEAAQRRIQLQKSQDPADFAQGVSDKAPVYLVDRGYYLLFDFNRVYCQTDDYNEKFPIILAKLNGQSKGSQTITVSYDKPDYIDFKEYKMLLETRPSYESLRKAYLAITNNRIQMNFALATKLFN